MLTGNAVVDALMDSHSPSSAVPNSWFFSPKFCNKSGTVNMLAMFILSDILYWYRPTSDYKDGEIRYRTRFRSDMLQKSYEDFAEKFNVPKRKVKDACDVLVSGGLIVRQFRTVKMKNGGKATNVMFVEPVPEVVLSIAEYPPSKNEGTLPTISVGPSHQNQHDPPPNFGDTNTKNTSENTTENTQEGVLTHATPNGSPDTLKIPGVKEVDSDEILRLHNERKGVANYGVGLDQTWKRFVSLVHDRQVYVTAQQRGQLKHLATKVGGHNRAVDVLVYVIEHWSEFGQRAISDGGKKGTYSSYPDIGFTLVHADTALDMFLQSISKKKAAPVPVPEPVVESLEDKIITYTAEEMDMILAGIKKV